MRYAIVESGGKQYRAVEGEILEVDRLPVSAGEKVGLERVLMLVDGDEVTVGTPNIADLLVSTTVMDHFKGPKITVFKYSPKKRIRVKSGHRQQYTRLMVDAIGRPAEPRKAAKAEKSEAPAEKKETATVSSPKGKKSVVKEKQAEKTPAKKTTTKKTTTEKASSTKTKKK